MANWIKAIYFVVILAWVIYVLSDDAVKYKSSKEHCDSFRDGAYASAVPDYGEDNVRAAGQAGTHSVQHPVIESGRTREQSDRNVEH